MEIGMYCKYRREERKQKERRQKKERKQKSSGLNIGEHTHLDMGQTERENEEQLWVSKRE